MWSFLSRYLAVFLYAYEYLKRNNLIRSVVLLVGLGFAFIVKMWGMDVALQILTIIVQGAMMLVFAIMQFVAIFWFMAQTKAVEIHPGDEKVLTLNDYWGNPQIVELMMQWNHLLVNRREFAKMGGGTINGILLFGPPGTGKSYLAQVMAGEGGVAFYGTDGSSFRAMFWGVDVLKVMAFIKKCKSLAKQYGGCIGFLDEIDAIGSARGGNTGQTGAFGGGMFGGMAGMGALQRLLYEMSGLEDTPLFDMCVNKVRRFFGLDPIDKGKVLIIGATNRPDVLDPALMRPGRFDTKLEIGIPDKKSRKEILEGYLNRIVHDDSIDLESLVADTTGITPAAIMSAVTKDAPRIALFDGRKYVNQADVEEAFQQQIMGIENPISDLEPEQKKSLAIHEASHAVAAHFLRPDQRIVRVTIVRRRGALGYVLPVSKEDIYTLPLETIVRGIMVSLAGTTGVELVFGKPWTGGTGDFGHVKMYMDALKRNGFFGVKSAAYFGEPQPGDPGKDPEKEFLDECRDRTKILLKEHRKALDGLVDALLLSETLTGREAVDIIEKAEVENGG